MRGERRVVVTGMGVVSSLGQSLDAYWGALLEGKSGISVLERIPQDDLSTTIAGEIKGWDPLLHFDKREARRFDLVVQYALVGTKSALADSGLDLARESRRRIGCIMGSGIGGLSETEEQMTNLIAKGPRRVGPMLVPKMMVNAVSGEISILHGLQGPNFTVVSACASAGHALCLAAQAIGDGRADVVITGGSEAAITRLGMSGFCNMKALSRRNAEPQRASRPFDQERDGFVMGEGAAVLVFEELSRARARGAKIYAEFYGGAYNADGYHITSPTPDGSGAAAAITDCLADSRLAPDGVDYVNAHGTSTELNDAMETKAIKLALGEHARKVAISSTKSMVGHLLGASGAVEAVAAVMAVHRDVVHPTANLEHPDPECDLDYVPGAAREMKVRAAISNSFGFGGHNVCLCVGKLR